MDLNAIMATQLSDLQQTVQLSVLQNAMNMQTTTAVQLLEQLPEQPQAVHPFKGTTIDIQV
ncbi:MULTISPECIES: YjfB family protein [Rummeliibacillus]|uniref:YjfB family protein n=1 Tax=Rummeliibacillus TaxID=648802 RepID=UPI0011B3ADDA|nr:MULTISPECIES: YjfB family protein [Rummeliibacillus]MBO2536115.1 YjfB family protein [Rummeliibacillus suwonensis]